MTLADVKPGRQRPGPKPRFTTADVVDAAIRISDTRGFVALSLREVAREMGLTPRALYSYVSDRDELVALVVNRLIEERARDVRWPRAWQGVLKTFASGMIALLAEHPYMIEAYGSGLVRTGGAKDAMEEVLERLCAGGLPFELALDAHRAVHAVILGHALVAAGAPKVAGPKLVVDPQVHPRLAQAIEQFGYQAAGGRFDELVDLVIAGLEQSLSATSERPSSRRRP